jgi:murein DD-endopeptidase MepM/ murein hydrolase activator NlpD
MRLHPVYKVWKMHKGVDLASSKNDPIVAVRSGVVSRATYDSSSGYYVVVNHGDGFSSLYMHMTHYEVSVGQTVSAGQLLGYVGSTGVSTGPHLHFSITYNGTHVNPADYINFG